MMKETECTFTDVSMIGKAIREKGMIVSVPVGTSMWPMLRNRRDNIVIVKADGRLKKHDVPLYQRKTGQLVLHRILKVRDHDYVMCGDHQTIKEYGITDQDILGVLKGFYRGNLYIDCKKNLIYRIYVNIWCVSIHFRTPFFLFHRIVGRIKRAFHKRTT